MPVLIIGIFFVWEIIFFTNIVTEKQKKLFNIFQICFGSFCGSVVYIGTFFFHFGRADFDLFIVMFLLIFDFLNMTEMFDYLSLQKYQVNFHVFHKFIYHVLTYFVIKFFVCNFVYSGGMYTTSTLKSFIIISLQ